MRPLASARTRTRLRLRVLTLSVDVFKDVLEGLISCELEVDPALADVSGDERFTGGIACAYRPSDAVDLEDRREVAALVERGLSR